MAVVFFFIDGIGIGPPEPHNPFARNTPESFKRLIGAGSLTSDTKWDTGNDLVCKAIDARLGIEGLPQSGTGQTALFTGINAAAHLGRHFGPFPHSKIKPFLQKESIFHKLMESGKSPVFLNAYPPQYFERIKARNRWSCTTLMAMSAGLEIRTTRHVMDGAGVTAEFFGDYWREKLGIQLPVRNGVDVAEIILDAAEENDLVLMEYYLTDKAGHDMDMAFAEDVLDRLDKVLNPLLDRLGTHTLLICSDHGNMEDLSVKTHTLNPVPLISCGPGAGCFRNAESIMDVSDGIMKALAN